MNTIDTVCPKDFNGREAAELVRLLSEKVKFPIFIEKDDRRVNGHSILGILSLCLKMGDKLKIHCDDKDSLIFVKNLFSIV